MMSRERSNKRNQQDADQLEVGVIGDVRLEGDAVENEREGEEVEDEELERTQEEVEDATEEPDVGAQRQLLRNRRREGPFGYFRIELYAGDEESLRHLITVHPYEKLLETCRDLKVKYAESGSWAGGKRY